MSKTTINAVRYYGHFMFNVDTKILENVEADQFVQEEMLDNTACIIVASAERFKALYGSSTSEIVWIKIQGDWQLVDNPGICELLTDTIGDLIWNGSV